MFWMKASAWQTDSDSVWMARLCILRIQLPASFTPIKLIQPLETYRTAETLSACPLTRACPMASLLMQTALSGMLNGTADKLSAIILTAKWNVAFNYQLHRSPVSSLAD